MQYDDLVISWCVPAPRSRLLSGRDNGPSHAECWAKTTADGRPGISVRDHCLNVGCVAEALLELLPGHLRRLLPPGAPPHSPPYTTWAKSRRDFNRSAISGNFHFDAMLDMKVVISESRKSS